MKNQQNILIIHNVRSVQNVGAMFRTADAAGIDKIYLTGYTPTPLDRFGRKRGDLAKSALGAEEFVNWEHKKLIFPKYIFDTNVSEVKGNLKNKMGKGYFKLAPLEVIYLLKMDIKNPSDINDLDLIRNSGEIDVDRLLSLFELNGWV